MHGRPWYIGPTAQRATGPRAHRRDDDGCWERALSPYWRRRLARHTLLAGAAALLSWLLVLGYPNARAVWRISIGTGYVGLAYLGWTLFLGPRNVLRRRPNPVSTDLRRDIAIWAAALGIIHFIAGWQVHLWPSAYFFWGPEWRFIPLRYDFFGLANWSGLAAVALLGGLLVISNDLSLRKLGVRLWKMLQRWAYVAFLLTAAHALAYAVIEQRAWPLLTALGLLLLAPVLAQWMGYRAYRLEQPERLEPEH